MSDPYNPCEKESKLTLGALKLIDTHGFGIVADTKSDLVLRWSGFQSTAGGRITESLSPDAIRVLRQGLENLLRRFVSRDWIAERLRKSEASDRSGK